MHTVERIVDTTATSTEINVRLAKKPRIFYDEINKTNIHVPESFSAIICKLLITPAHAPELRTCDNTVFVAKKTDSLPLVFKGLLKHGFLSCPVVNASPGFKEKFHGFIDLLDIVHFVVKLFNNVDPSRPDFWKGVHDRDEFRAAAVKDVMKYPLSRNNPFPHIQRGFSFLHAIELMARNQSLYRIPILNEDGYIETILTQTTVIRYLHENKELLGVKAAMTASSFPRENLPITMLCSDIAMEAFKKLDHEKAAAIVIVDNDGKFIGAVSARDIKAMYSDAGSFWHLWCTLDIFIRHINESRALSTKGIVVPVTVNSNTNLSEMLDMFVEFQVDCLFEVDTERKPISVISIKDILLALITL